MPSRQTARTGRPSPRLVVPGVDVETSSGRSSTRAGEGLVTHAPRLARDALAQPRPPRLRDWADCRRCMSPRHSGEPRRRRLPGVDQHRPAAPEVNEPGRSPVQSRHHRSARREVDERHAHFHFASAEIGPTRRVPDATLEEVVGHMRPARGGGIENRRATVHDRRRPHQRISGVRSERQGLGR